MPPATQAISCPRCGNAKTWKIRRKRGKCSACKREFRLPQDPVMALGPKWKKAAECFISRKTTTADLSAAGVTRYKYYTVSQKIRRALLKWFHDESEALSITPLDCTLRIQFACQPLPLTAFVAELSVNTNFSHKSSGKHCLFSPTQTATMNARLVNFVFWTAIEKAGVSVDVVNERDDDYIKDEGTSYEEEAEHQWEKELRLRQAIQSTLIGQRGVNASNFYEYVAEALWRCRMGKKSKKQKLENLKRIILA